MRRFLTGFGLVFITVAGIIFAITFVERLPFSVDAASAATLAFYRLLGWVPTFLPLTVFMGTLLTSYNLTRSSESVIISGAGLSSYQKSRPFFAVAFLIGIFATTVINPFAGGKNTTGLDIDSFELTDSAVWLREAKPDGAMIMRATGVAATNGGLEFSNATVFIQGQNAKLTQRIDAKSLILDSGGFRTKSAKIFDADSVSFKTGEWSMASQTTPQNFMEQHLKPDQVSFWKLPGLIQNLRQLGVPVRGHLVQFWTLLFLPLTLIAMTVLGIAFSQTHQRRNYSFGIKFGIGIMVCFALYFIINIFGALGANGTLPPLLAVLVPPLIIATVSAASVVSFESI